MSGRHCLTDKCQFGGTQMFQLVKGTESPISLAAQVQAPMQVKCRKWRTHDNKEGNLTRAE